MREEKKMRRYLFEDSGFLKTELFEISEFQEVICWIWYFPICSVLDTGKYGIECLYCCYIATICGD
jgi:hypothetical protein